MPPVSVLAENACNSAQATTSWPRPVAGDFGENGEKKEDNLFEISQEMSAVDWAAGSSSSVWGERLSSVSSREPADATAGVRLLRRSATKAGSNQARRPVA